MTLLLTANCFGVRVLSNGNKTSY